FYFFSGEDTKMRKKPLHLLLRVLFALGILGLCGCAANSIYTVPIDYDAGDAVIPSYLEPSNRDLQSLIAVAEFTDKRQVDDPLVIGRVIERNGLRVLVLPKTLPPTQAVSQGLRRYLRKAGYNVAGSTDPWDLQERNLPQTVGRVLIGGSIDELDVICRREWPTNAYSAKIRLTIYLADSQTRAILYRSTVESMASLEHVLFSEERLGEQAAAAIGAAIEKLFEKRELSQHLKDALRR
ncbi:MAG TPA: hypothetical protein PK090_11335, partial [Smithellaceae bacterium]|nr:hypothetical protein [Smithellaceae bacterium]